MARKFNLVIVSLRYSNYKGSLPLNTKLLLILQIKPILQINYRSIEGSKITISITLSKFRNKSK